MQKKAQLTLKLTPNDQSVVSTGTRIKQGDLLVKGKEIKSVKFDLPKILRLSPSKALKYLKVKEGDTVEKGSIIAVKKGLLSKEIIRSPKKGKLVFLDREKGIFAILEEKKRDEIISWFSGKVSKVDADKIIFELSGQTVSGSAGKGSPVSGKLLIVPEVDLLRMPTDLDERILAIIEATPDIVAKADTLGALAIIAQKIAEPLFSLPYVLIDDISTLTKFNHKTVIVYGDEKQLLIVSDDKI